MQGNYSKTMARGKKVIMRPNRSTSGLQNSSTATSVASPSPLVTSVPLLKATNPSSSELGIEVGQVAASVGEGGVASAAASVGEDGDGPAQSGTKRTSHVWEYFKEYEKIERVKDAEGKIVEIVHKRAHCIYCPKGKIGDFSVENKSGTSGLLRHINHNYPTDEEDQFDILCWWKVNGCKFPVLAAIARDVLAIQTSIVASESCFSTWGRVIDCFKSSLTPKSVEGLICMQNWMLGDDIAEVVEDIDEPTIENTKFYYDVEREHESTASSKNNCPPPTAKGKGKGKGKSVATGILIDD
uniref:uncharacterized protein LOC105352682 n=1 Tax=Fragaria vesca subsp. vesca TaxID=101020 RepID=UPI0005CB4CB3|nr:PREDICTED: uncharacterized protein LOC105352682 [Fragaria vesca subsp. vesca]